MLDLVGNPDCWFSHVKAWKFYITDCSKAILQLCFLLFSVLVLNFCAVCTLCAFFYIFS